MREPLYRRTYEAAILLRDHPPRFQHPHKAALFEIADPRESSAAVQIDVTRWRQETPQAISLAARLATDIQPNFYDYLPVGGAVSSVEWHVNFADPRLFVAYGSRLFAQDEMQVAEHPLLACVLEALLAENLTAKTSDETGATPILVTNVERRLEVRTDPNAAAGRPFGLYGNRFAAASIDVVLQATRRIAPPRFTHFIAIAAPAGGSGAYTFREIEFIFATAFTAFAAAVQESNRLRGESVQTIIHTGFWGCGAFGGDRLLMIALQALAARAANVGRLVLHAGDAAGVQEVRRALDVAERLASLCGASCPLAALVNQALALGRRWGTSDGN